MRGNDTVTLVIPAEDPSQPFSARTAAATTEYTHCRVAAKCPLGVGVGVGVMVHTYDPSIWKAEIRRSL